MDTSRQRFVSCRVLVMVRQILVEAGISWREVILPIGYSEEFLMNPRNRISWEAYTVLLKNALAKSGGRDRFVEISRKWGVGDQMIPMRRVSRACLSAEQLYRALLTLTLSLNFRGIFTHSVRRFREDDALRLEVRVTLDPQLTGSRELFESTAGVFEGYPNMIGYPRAKVEVKEISSHHTVLIVTPPPFNNLWTRFVSWIETPFRVKDTLTVVSAQEKALWENVQELERRKNDLEALFTASAEGITLVADGVVLYTNPAMVALLKLPDPEAMIGRKTDTWVQPETIASLRLWVAQRPAADERREIQIRDQKGELLLVEVVAPRSVRWNDRDATLWMMREVGEQRRIEAAAAQASEREQRRIADDLHDGLGQEMTAIALQLEILRIGLARAGHPEQVEAARLVEQVSAATRHARDIAHGLAPRIVVERGMLAGLQWLAAHTSDAFAMTVTVESKVSAEAFGPGVVSETAVTVYRAAQEILTNARRHGRAKAVRIGITQRGGELIFSFVDDGVGYVPDPVRKTGMGLKIMRHRLSSVGGHCTIQARGDGEKGTEVILVLPWSSEAVPSPGVQPSAVTVRPQRDEGPWRVLVVDDHAIVRDGVSRVLEQTGDFKVVGQAACSSEALAFAEAAPEVAVVDLFLAGESGLELLPQLREKHPGIRTVVFSMGAEQLYAEAALKAGAQAFVSKQAKPETLLVTLRRVIAD